MRGEIDFVIVMKLLGLSHHSDGRGSNDLFLLYMKRFVGTL